MTPLEIIIALCEYLSESPDQADVPMMVDTLDGFFYIKDDMTKVMNGTKSLALMEVPA